MTEYNFVIADSDHYVIAQTKTKSLIKMSQSLRTCDVTLSDLPPVPSDQVVSLPRFTLCWCLIYRYLLKKILTAFTTKLTIQSSDNPVIP